MTESALEMGIAEMGTAPATDQVEAGVSEPPVVNEVLLRGRVSAEPVARELPSGDTLVTLRLVVPRPPARAGEPRRRPTVDTLDCAVWSARLRRSVVTWAAGDVVEVRGAIRRRFYRSGSGPVSRVEVELTHGRLIRRSGSASARPDSASAGTTSPSPAAAVP